MLVCYKHFDLFLNFRIHIQNIICCFAQLMVELDHYFFVLKFHQFILILSILFFLWPPICKEQLSISIQNRSGRDNNLIFDKLQDSIFQIHLALHLFNQQKIILKSKVRHEDLEKHDDHTFNSKIFFRQQIRYHIIDNACFLKETFQQIFGLNHSNYFTFFNELYLINFIYIIYLQYCIFIFEIPIFNLYQNKLRQMKQAHIYAVDAGYSMNQCFSETTSRMGLAFQCISYTLQQQLFQTTNCQISIVLFGEDQADDGNHQILHPLVKPNLKLIRDIQVIRKTRLQNKRAGGDIFKVIAHSIGEIITHCSTKKYTKRLFVFTNGQGKTQYTSQQAQQLINTASKNQIRVNVIAVDFMEDYDYQKNIIIGKTYLDYDQQINAKLLIAMRKQKPESIQILPATIAIELYRQFRKKQVNPVACFRGQMQLSPNFTIEVSTYKKVRQQKLKTLKKYNLKEEFSPNEKVGLVQNDIAYQVHDDPTGQIVPPQHQVRAYQYGKNIIPISEALEGKAKLLEQKCMKLLGFVSKDKIPRHSLMGSIDIVIPGQDISSKKLFTAFIFSMLTLNRYAVVRYIARNMKNGVSPKLMVLIPYRSGKNECFYMSQLPTAQDVRDYQFRSLKPASQIQKKLVAQLIEKMDLMVNKMGEPQQQLRIKNLFNPTIQRFYQVIFHRVFNLHSQLPPLDPNISSYLKPETHIYAKTNQLCERLKKEFGLVKKQVPKEKVEVKLVWKDYIQSKPQNSIASESTNIDDIPVCKKFTMDQEQVLHIDQKKPIETFMKMLNNQHKDLVNIALKEFSDLIKLKVINSMDQEGFKICLSFMQTLRQGCLEQKQQQYWDQFLRESLKKFPAGMCKILKEQGVGFLKRDNRQLFNPVNLTKLIDQVQVDELD